MTPLLALGLTFAVLTVCYLVVEGVRDALSADAKRLTARMGIQPGPRTAKPWWIWFPVGVVALVVAMLLPGMWGLVGALAAVTLVVYLAP